MNSFTQLCVWRGTILGKSTSEDFEKFFQEECQTRVKFAEEVTTLPGKDSFGKVISEGGRNDLLFFVHSEDIPKFAVKRFAFEGISWWEDVLDNEKGIYSEELIEKYAA